MSSFSGQRDTRVRPPDHEREADHHPHPPRDRPPVLRLERRFPERSWQAATASAPPTGGSQTEKRIPAKNPCPGDQRPGDPGVPAAGRRKYLGQLGGRQSLDGKEPGDLCRRRGGPARRDGLPVRRRAGDGHLPGAARCSARCCSRASPAPARPRWPRRSPRRSTCRWSGCSATRASTPPRRSTTGTSRARSCTCARSRLRRTAGRRRGGREEPVRRAVPARAAGAGRAPAEPGRAAGRRGGPGRRRVRGVPARGAVDLAGLASPSSAPSRPRPRRSSSSPPTAPASSTTRSSGAASTTGSSTPASSASSQIVRSRAPEVSEALGPPGRRRRAAAARRAT